MTKTTHWVVMGCAILLLTLLPLRSVFAEVTPAPRGTPAPAPAGEQAEQPAADDSGAGASIDTKAGLKSIGKSTTGKEIGISRVANVQGLIARIIYAVLSLVGVIFFILIVYAGFLWMTGGGNEEHIKKAKGIFASAFIGLLIVLTSYYLVDFVFQLLEQSLTAG